MQGAPLSIRAAVRAARTQSRCEASAPLSACPQRRCGARAPQRARFPWRILPEELCCLPLAGFLLSASGTVTHPVARASLVAPVRRSTAL